MFDTNGRQVGMIVGGCLCGAARYEAAGEPLFSVLCYCRDCQRASGTGHVPVMGVARDGFRSRGPIRSHAVVGGSGHVAVRHFCEACGGLLFGLSGVAPGLVTIYAGSLDDPSRFRPQSAQFVRSRADWDGPGDALPEYEAAAP